MYLSANRGANVDNFIRFRNQLNTISYFMVSLQK